MSDNRPKWVHEGHLALQRAKLGCNVDGLFQKVRKGSRWIAPPLSLYAIWLRKSDAFRAAFCEHDKLWIEQCSGCKRTRKEAKQRLLKMMSHHAKP